MADGIHFLCIFVKPTSLLENSYLEKVKKGHFIAFICPNGVPRDRRQDPGSVQRANSSLRLQKLPSTHWVSWVPIHQLKVKKKKK